MLDTLHRQQVRMQRSFAPDAEPVPMQPIEIIDTIVVHFPGCDTRIIEEDGFLLQFLSYTTNSFLASLCLRVHLTADYECKIQQYETLVH